ncbi:YL1 nuclear protein-domain-containing protein [Chytridium lagenaria]|nr:YL1 nuclear protein-domain-containing protein [Chytridium lagenaria]
MMRERRANAGSRMKQLIEEQRASAALKDEEEDDADFQEADEEDIVDSDFESTDEDEAANEAGMMVDEDPGDAETRRQAKRAKLIAAQTGKSRGFQPPTTKVRQHALSQSLDPVGPSTVVVTTGQGPGAIGSTTKKRTKERIEKKIELEKEKEKEREKGLSISLSPARRSYRASTMYSKILLEQKMEKNKQRQQVTLKRKSPHEVQLTQRELLAEAVDITEPFNLSYLEQMRIRDEEKRRQSKAIKPRLPPGPTITYISMRSDRYQQIITEISQEMAATENATNLEDRGPVDRPIEKIAAKGLESDSVRVLPQSTSKGSLVERSSILGENGGQTFGNSAASPADAPLDSMDSSCKNLIIFENYDEDPS